MAAWTRTKYAAFSPLSLARTKFCNFLQKHSRSSAEMGKFCSSAQNYAFCWKLWSLLISAQPTDGLIRFLIKRNIKCHRIKIIYLRNHNNITQVHKLNTEINFSLSFFSHSLPPMAGKLWEIKNETLKFPLHHFSLFTLNISTSHITSTPSAFEVILQLTCYINYLLTYWLLTA